MKKNLLYILLFFSVALALFAWAASHRPPDLIARATRVPGYRTNDYMLDNTSWESSSVVLIKDKQRGSSADYLRLDIVSGVLSRLTVPTPGIAPRPTWQDWVYLAPNGRRLLYRTKDRWRLIALNGAVVQEWPAWGSQILWSPDGREFIALNDDYSKFRSYEPGKPAGETRKVGIPEAYPRWYSGHVTIGFQSGSGGSTKFVLLAADGKGRSDIKVALPTGTAVVSGARMNPQGDKIAWYLGTRPVRVPWIHLMLQRLGLRGVTFRNPAGTGTQPPPNYESEGIWVSDRDGKNMREVGEVKAEWAPYGMGSFCWCPDGKHVLISYRNGIYVVPID